MKIHLGKDFLSVHKFKTEWQIIACFGITNIPEAQEHQHLQAEVFFLWAKYLRQVNFVYYKVVMKCNYYAI